MLPEPGHHHAPMTRTNQPSINNPSSTLNSQTCKRRVQCAMSHWQCDMASGSGINGPYPGTDWSCSHPAASRRSSMSPSPVNPIEVARVCLTNCLLLPFMPLPQFLPESVPIHSGRDGLLIGPYVRVVDGVMVLSSIRRI